MRFYMDIVLAVCAGYRLPSTAHHISKKTELKLKLHIFTA